VRSTRFQDQKEKVRTNKTSSGVVFTFNPTLNERGGRGKGRKKPAENRVRPTEEEGGEKTGFRRVRECLSLPESNQERGSLKSEKERAGIELAEKVRGKGGKGRRFLGCIKVRLGSEGGRGSRKNW